MTAVKSLEIALDGIEDGLELVIDSRKPKTLFDSPDFEQFGESRYQLVEGCFYDYELRYIGSSKPPAYEFTANSYVVPHSRKKQIGSIAPNIYVGTLSLKLIHPGKPAEYYEVALEVRSVKADYRTDYRDMLEFITERCTELLMQSDAPAYHNFEPDFNEDSQSLYQKFTFIKSIVGSDEFNEAVHRIITNPATQWKETNELKDIRRVKRFTNNNVRQFLSGSNRTRLPGDHFLNQYGLDSLPVKIQTSQKVDCIDTAENRFIKHALEVFTKFSTDIYEAPKASADLKEAADLLIRNLEGHLSHSVFKEISRANTLKLNSPLLQRKEGYREVYKAWLMFDLAAKLIWSGGDDVYHLGKKDIAVLYEYWLFFKLLELFEKSFQLKSKPVDELIEKRDNGLNLRLKQGTYIPLEGVYNHAGRKLNVRFSYNRSFGGKSDYPNSGSWTTTLRPDYTLSVWPAGIKEKQAEQEELIVHVHFDAKYKVENFADYLKQQSDDELDSEKTANRKGIYKNADLLKMHAYKDAIRRTGGAYVLYPGTEKIKQRGFHEIIPGLGAFPVRPSKTDSGIAELKNFILEVVDHFVNRASQREKIAYRTFDIYKQPPLPDDKLEDILPEAYAENRGLLPDETHVLVGFCKNKEHLEWCIRKGLYNARTESAHGSLKLGIGESTARYLLLHLKDGLKTNLLFRIVEGGPRVFSAQKLEREKYPTPPRQPFYLVYQIDQNIQPELKHRIWDVSKLADYRTGRQSGVPFTATLRELMKVTVKE